MFVHSAPGVLSSCGARGKALAAPVWKPTSTVRNVCVLYWALLGCTLKNRENTQSSNQSQLIPIRRNQKHHIFPPPPHEDVFVEHFGLTLFNFFSRNDVLHLPLQMWYPHRAKSNNFNRVDGIFCRRGVTKLQARTRTDFSANYGVSSGITDSMVMGMIKFPIPAQSWTYVGSKDA